jgi:hypothetical protein
MGENAMRPASLFCVGVLLWWEYEISHRLVCWTLGPQLVVLFWKALETSGGGEAGGNRSLGACLWGLCLVFSCFLILCFQSAMRWRVSHCHDVLLRSHGPNPLKSWAKVNSSSLSCSVKYFGHSDKKSFLLKKKTNISWVSDPSACAFFSLWLWKVDIITPVLIEDKTKHEKKKSKLRNVLTKCSTSKRRSQDLNRALISKPLFLHYFRGQFGLSL